MTHRVKQVADMAGISVRTLHHYDHIGLLRPGSVSSAGYRLYTDRDLEILQQILFFKELGFSLQRTKEIICSPDFDRHKALKLHRDLLAKKRERLDQLIKAVDKTMKTFKGGEEMNNEDRLKAFDMSEIEKHQEKYAEEARRKWGHTDAYKESQKKTAKYSKEDWARLMMRQEEVFATIASLMDRSPDDPEVQQAVAEWRQHISDSFYNCTPEIFRGLGDMYVADERFTANIDKIKPGLAAFLKEAMSIYCDKLDE
jgi:DNA-binding transcriptional MerR regulator